MASFFYNVIMAIINSSGTPLYENNNLQFAPPIRKKRVSGRNNLWGFIGFLRIAILVTEIVSSLVASALAPSILPAVIALGTIGSQTLDSYQYATNQINTSQFAVSTIINFVPLGLEARNFKYSTQVFKIADPKSSTGFRYIVDGIDRGFNNVFKNLAKGWRPSGPNIKLIRKFQERTLINRHIIPPFLKKFKSSEFEEALQLAFGGSANILSEKGGQFITSGVRQGIFRNLDLAKIRRQIWRLHEGNTTIKKSISYFQKTLSKKARAEINENYEPILKHLLKVFRRSLQVSEKVQKGGKLLNLFKWFGRRSGRGFTQFAQMGEANDVAREVLNRPVGLFLGGRLQFLGKDYRIFGKKFARMGGLRGWARKLRSKMPTVQKILKSPITKKLAAKYAFYKEQLGKRGVLCRSDTFLMGWIYRQKHPFYSTVTFYFNPKNTNAKRLGSKNWGGKRTITTRLSNDHLNYLRFTLDTGKVYFKRWWWLSAYCN